MIAFCVRFPASSSAQSIPARTPAPDPVPWHDSTCTDTIVACLATPYVVPAAVDAQCVPCPEQVDEAIPPKIQSEPHVVSVPVWHPALQPARARPPKSACEMRTPVSRMYTTEFEPVAAP
eukprot:5757642-Prymnesium_polylepis.1